MARTNVPIIAMAPSVGLAEPVGVAADQPNGHVIPAGGDTDRLLLIARNTAATPKNVTVKAGDNPPSVRAGAGDLVVAVTNAQERWFLIEGARHVQAGGELEIDLEAGFTGTIAAVRFPVA